MYIELGVACEEKGRPELLAHEQAYFDLCEIYTRLLRKTSEDKHLTLPNLNRESKIVLKKCTHFI
ncbi:MAG: hypothetical protein H7211_05585 [Aquabacterium sp.]|nr:hypothetical protein [Ferruginibacter sp.]